MLVGMLQYTIGKAAISFSSMRLRPATNRRGTRLISAWWIGKKSWMNRIPVAPRFRACRTSGACSTVGIAVIRTSYRCDPRWRENARRARKGVSDHLAMRCGSNGSRAGTTGGTIRTRSPLGPGTSLVDPSGEPDQSIATTSTSWPALTSPAPSSFHMGSSPGARL